MCTIYFLCTARALQTAQTWAVLVQDDRERRPREVEREPQAVACEQVIRRPTAVVHQRGGRGRVDGDGGARKDCAEVAGSEGSGQRKLCSRRGGRERGPLVHNQLIVDPQLPSTPQHTQRQKRAGRRLQGSRVQTREAARQAPLVHLDAVRLLHVPAEGARVGRRALASCGIRAAGHHQTAPMHLDAAAICP
eukprot:186544-Rhodomonas_salina.3